MMALFVQSTAPWIAWAASFRPTGTPFLLRGLLRECPFQVPNYTSLRGGRMRLGTFNCVVLRRTSARSSVQLEETPSLNAPVCHNSLVLTQLLQHIESLSAFCLPTTCDRFYDVTETSHNIHPAARPGRWRRLERRERELCLCHPRPQRQCAHHGLQLVLQLRPPIRTRRGRRRVIRRLDSSPCL
jgi:hypothetical protein